MQRKSFVITAALVTGLALGLIFGPATRATITSAQTQPPAQATPQSQLESLRNLFLDKLAAALNIQRPALDTAITTAGTGTLADAVQQGTLTQEQADAIRPRIESGDVAPLFGGHRFRGGHRGGRELMSVAHPLGVAMVDAAARALGLTADQLWTELGNGQTIAQLAQAKNTTEQAVTTAALAAAKTELDRLVSAGTMTQAQAYAIYSRLQQECLRFGRGGHGPGSHGGRGDHGAPATPAPAAPAGTTGL